MKKMHLYIRNIIWILLIYCNGSFAQLLKQKDSYTVYVNYPDYTVKASVSNSTKRLPVDESLTYFWYSSNRIIQTKGDYDGKIIDGPYTSFYLSNSLKEKGNFKKGLKNGKWISWYENGKIDEISNWHKGKKSGSYRKFNPDETLNLSANYKNDLLNGVQTTYTGGEIESETKYRKGKEVVKKQKQQTGKADSVSQEHTTLKNKISSLFKKKKQEPDAGKTTQPSTQKKTSKEKLKEKWNKLFKRKEKKQEPGKVEPTSTDATNASNSEVDSLKKSKKKKTGT